MSHVNALFPSKPSLALLCTALYNLILICFMFQMETVPQSYAACLFSTASMVVVWNGDEVIISRYDRYCAVQQFLHNP